MNFTEQQKKRLLRFSVSAAVLTVVGTLLIQKDNLLHRIADGISFAGILILCLGGLELAAYLGMFDLFLFSHKKLKRYSKRSEKEAEEEEYEGDNIKNLKYHEYLAAKDRTKNYRFPLLFGLLLVAFSGLLSIL